MRYKARWFLAPWKLKHSCTPIAGVLNICTVLYYTNNLAVSFAEKPLPKQSRRGEQFHASQPNPYPLLAPTCTYPFPFPPPQSNPPQSNPIQSNPTTITNTISIQPPPIPPPESTNSLPHSRIKLPLLQPTAVAIPRDSRRRRRLQIRRRRIRLRGFGTDLLVRLVVCFLTVT